MSFAWSLYDRIIDLSDAFANHFNNLLALDFQEETVQVGQDANQEQWRQVERGRRTRRVDPQADQARRESLAQKLTLDTVAPNMDVHTALFKDLLAFQFASPGMYGLDELWDGTQLKWQCADLHAGVSRHTPLLYELESPDPQASNYWALENRLVGEVNYVQLFHWIQNQTTLWQDGISTVFVYVDNRPLSDPSQCPNFWGLFCPWLLARCSYLGPFQEITTAIHVPIDASSGLDKVHFTWAGTFVLEALVYLFPDKHIVLIDTDCAPTSLFEVEELVRMTQTHLDQAAGVEPNTIRGNRKPACKSAVFLCSEAKAEINAPAWPKASWAAVRRIYDLLIHHQTLTSWPVQDSYGHLWPQPSQHCLSIGPTHGRSSESGLTILLFRYPKHPLMERLFGHDMAQQTC